MPLPLRSSASQASSEPGSVQLNFSGEPFPFRSKFTPACGSLNAIPFPATSITTGEPPHSLQPPQVQVLKSKSPPTIRHLLANGRLQLVLVEEQHMPDPIATVPAGHVPSLLTVVQLLGVGRLHEKCSAFASRHRLPPEIETPACATETVRETFAFVPQLVPSRHDENATPVAAAH